MGTVFDAETLRRSMSLFAEALRQHRDEIDSLNVFPVPDGDTGSNMLLTQQAVVSAMSGLDGSGGDLPALAEAIARSSLVGARGNSGVILSQILGAMVARLAAEDANDPRAFAEALGDASTGADRAVARPVDGTILSVLRDAASAASESAAGGTDLAGVVDAALEQARRSLAATTNLLPELRKAQVVDAGGKGILLLFAALRAALRQEPLVEPVGRSGPVGAGPGGPDAPGVDGAVEVQYLIRGDEGAVAALRRSLSDIGDSVAIVGGGGLYKVHVHTGDPDAAVRMGRTAGAPFAVTTASLMARGGCGIGEARGVQAGTGRTALVAVTEGRGLAATFRSLGATVVQPEPDRVPSPEELAAAIESAPAVDVLVLTSDPALVTAAEGAAHASGKRVRVVPTASSPAGVSAAAAFNPYEGLDGNATAAREAGQGVRSGAVASAASAGTAVRDDSVRTEDWVGIEDGIVLSSGDTPEVAAGGLASALASSGSELVTLIVGAGADQGEAGRVAAAVARAVPGAEVHVVDGGQTGSRYLIGVE